ncbi:hypothetical protein N476_09695 [Pseudoalteromonas luteoviolacea H33]|uniref:Uncharacterized protein n=2 Tax=Pseudoalteromonas luteoviolacea TaxID=43657 RepID=A0A162AMZ8_9GAMM|nr:hypothetical protein N476_09695 [Pseudoalteromonas luteoviolacea H33]KZN73826.1 hypothetical protein N477_22670 [Pseudoalteromonas luteoviolacea H33-S]
MRVSILFFLLIISCMSNAKEVFFRGSECTKLPEGQDVHFKESTNFDKKYSKDEAVADLKKALLNKAYVKASNGTSYLIESIRFKQDEEKIRGGKITRSAQITGFLHLSPITGCEHGQVISTDESNKLSYFYNFSKIRLEKAQVETLVQEQMIPSLKISDKRIYGLELGISYQDALKQIGRFSFDWRVNDIWRLATIGRNTVLFFEQDMLVGGQYHRDLLPTVWSNFIEIAATKPLLEVNNTEINMTYHAMSESSLTSLEQKYSLLDYDRFRISEDEVELRLSGLALGKLPNKEDFSFSLACYDEQDGVQNFIDKNLSSLPKFYSQTGEIGVLTGCNQVLYLWNDESFKSLLLSERANFNSTQLIHANMLSKGFSDWSFYGVEYLKGIQSNNALTIKHAEDDVYDVKAGSWLGYFVADEGLAFQGQFYVQ